MKNRYIKILLLSLVSLAMFFSWAGTAKAVTSEQGSVGLEGHISAPPPTTPATISIPRNGQAFTELPVTVSGLCTGDVLVKVFKNNVFAGSNQCKNGSFSLIIDLFQGQNELVARVYDALDQAGPDSNVVTVSFTDPKTGAGSRVSLTSNYAKRGVNPGQQLNWPIILSGGSGPYAISVDWGDGKTPDLLSQGFPGTFTISHSYDNPGVYNIIVRASDKSGAVAFLQLVGVANGPLSQDNGGSSSGNNNTNSVVQPAKILWQPAAILIPLILSTFWLGKKYQMKVLRTKIERGDRPF